MITLVIYLFCKHKHIRTIVASLLLHKAKEVEARTPTKINDSECGIHQASYLVQLLKTHQPGH